MNNWIWVFSLFGMIYLGCRHLALWWRVQDLERVVRELIKEVDEDNE